MAEVKPLSVSKVVAGLGGALLLAAFFLPMVSEEGRGEVRRELTGTQGLRAQFESSRELTAVQPLVEPALQAMEAFIETPSLLRLSGLASASTELLGTAADLGVDQADEMRLAARLLSLARMSLWLLPLAGLVQMLVPAISRLRGYAGVGGLMARFLFGLLFALVAMVPIAGVSEAQRPFIGPAVWSLLTGSLLMMLASVAGVTRSNWWMVLLGDVVILFAVVAGLVGLAEAFH